MLTGISTLSSFLLTKEIQEGLTGARLVFDAGMMLAEGQKNARALSAGLGPAWSGYAFDSPTGSTVIVLEKRATNAL